MPEGPECKTIAEGLNASLAGKTLLTLEPVAGRYVTHGPFPGYEALRAAFPLTCTSVNVKGKFIYMRLSDGSSIWNTLGMTGTWGHVLRNHVRVTLKYAGQGQQWSLYFSDPRNFGTFSYVRERASLDRKLSTLGLDLLNDDVDGDAIRSMMVRKRNLKRTLAEVLMDQRCFAGVGNYIKCEALYRARLSPHRTVESLSKDDVGLLGICVSEIMHEAYESGGTSMSDYVDIQGVEGRFRRIVHGQRYDEHHNPVVSEKTLDGRTTHWVPNIQR